MIHYWWLVKADVRKPQYYAIVLILLLGYRLLAAQRKKAAAAARVPAPSRTQTATGD